MTVSVSQSATALFSDGGCIGPNPSPTGGTWAWCIADASDARVWSDAGVMLTEYQDNLDPLDYSPEIETLGVVTNNQMEFLALLRGIEFLPEDWDGVIASDSMITLGRFFVFRGTPGQFELPPGIERIAQRGSSPWRLKGIPLSWAERMNHVVMRLGKCKIVLLDGHPNKEQLGHGQGKRGQPVSRHNVWCDSACTNLARDFKANSKGLISNSTLAPQSTER